MCTSIGDGRASGEDCKEAIAGMSMFDKSVGVSAEAVQGVFSMGCPWRRVLGKTVPPTWPTESKEGLGEGNVSMT